MAILSSLLRLSLLLLLLEAVAGGKPRDNGKWCHKVVNNTYIQHVPDQVSHNVLKIFKILKSIDF